MATSTIPNGPRGINDQIESGSGATENLVCYGFVGNSGKTLWIYLRPVKLLIKPSSVSVSALTLTGRIIGGGYIGGAGSYNVYSNSSSVGAWVSGRDILVQAVKKSGTWANNGTTFFGNASTFTYAYTY